MAPNHRQNLAQHIHISSADDLSYSVSPSSGINDTIQTIVTGRKCWKTMKGKGEVVWPPYLEAALVEGLEKYQPVESRTSRSFGRFPMRNKFISDYIFQVTGKRRTPKQVGSRLQQLRDTTEGKRILQQLSSRHMAMMQPKGHPSSATSASGASTSASGPAHSSPASAATPPSGPGSSSAALLPTAAAAGRPHPHHTDTRPSTAGSSSSASASASGSHSPHPHLGSPAPAARVPTSFVCIDVLPDPGTPPLRLPSLAFPPSPLSPHALSHSHSHPHSPFAHSPFAHPHGHSQGTALASFVPSPGSPATHGGLGNSTGMGMGVSMGLNAAGPRVLRQIDPTVTFMSRAALQAFSAFRVVRHPVSASPVGGSFGLADTEGAMDTTATAAGGEAVHEERTELELLSSSCMPMPQWASEIECTFLYRTRFVPRFWEVLCRAADPSVYTVHQEIVRAPSSSSHSHPHSHASSSPYPASSSSAHASAPSSSSPGPTDTDGNNGNANTDAEEAGAYAYAYAPEDVLLSIVYSFNNVSVSSAGAGGSATGTPPLSPDSPAFAHDGSRPGTAGSGAGAHGHGFAGAGSGSPAFGVGELDEMMLFHGSGTLDASSPLMHAYPPPSHHGHHSQHQHQSQHAHQQPHHAQRYHRYPPHPASTKPHAHTHADESDAYASLPPTPTSPFDLAPPALPLPAGLGQGWGAPHGHSQHQHGHAPPPHSQHGHGHGHGQQGQGEGHGMQDACAPRGGGGGGGMYGLGLGLGMGGVGVGVGVVGDGFMHGFMGPYGL